MKVAHLTPNDMVLIDVDGTAEWALVDRVDHYGSTVEVDYDVTGGIITRHYHEDEEVEV